MKTLYAVLILTLLGGCAKHEYSTFILEETVTVRDLVYLPRQHGSGIGVGYTSGGNVAIVPNNIDVTEAYAIVFECSHGSFIIDDWPELWKQLREGEDYTALYQESYEVINDTARTVVGYHFLGIKEFPNLMRKVKQ
jgi:hypothetical protein